jgi:hypothetical protein
VKLVGSPPTVSELYHEGLAPRPSDEPSAGGRSEDAVIRAGRERRLRISRGKAARAQYAREQSGQRQPSRTGDQPGPEARSCSGENVCPQRQHVRPGHWDSGGMTHGSDTTRGYEHAFAPPAYAKADHPLSQRRMTDGIPTRWVRHPALITQTG